MQSGDTGWVLIECAIIFCAITMSDIIFCAIIFCDITFCAITMIAIIFCANCSCFHPSSYIQGIICHPLNLFAPLLLLNSMEMMRMFSNPSRPCHLCLASNLIWMISFQETLQTKIESFGNEKCIRKKMDEKKMQRKKRMLKKKKMHRKKKCIGRNWMS